ncbi:DUF2520 domain-containing protein [Raineyella sp. W15-4]|uniref:Rossmann-like and DUF2520 domain-containing protein n=1 Tax=Raineyella sp. W15-4 TaxID=3081651 RepID=UPI00295313B1|nr:DUF2520 domain-containing protein [Raineyella sp. W15-4]WOQ15978.1 DUF2520 domain-containing protein [Raineyella sp. W15-4]
MSGVTVAVLGTGRLAHALTGALTARGVAASMLSARDPDRARALDADLTVLAVSDDAIGPLAAALAAEAGEPADADGTSGVVHCSGALDLAPLAPLATGRWLGAWHPMQAFATVDTPIAPGVTWGITAEAELREVLVGLTATLGGRPVLLREEDRPRYHAAATMASNYTVVLIDHAARLLQDCGLDADAALEALLPLVRTSLDGLQGVGLPGGLTGPAVRGDVGTIRRHLAALADRPDTAALYRAAGRAAHDLLVARGMGPATLAAVDAALRDPGDGTGTGA